MRYIYKADFASTTTSTTIYKTPSTAFVCHTMPARGSISYKEDNVESESNSLKYGETSKEYTGPKSFFVTTEHVRDGELKLDEGQTGRVLAKFSGGATLIYSDVGATSSQ